MKNISSKNLKLKAFTLIEVMVGILIFSVVIISGFDALNSLMVGKVKLIEKTKIEKEAYYFSEKFFNIVKMGGTIDYEEYFNRKIIGSSYLSGHFSTRSGFGNFGEGGVPGTGTYGSSYYYCLSGNVIGDRMGTGGCLTDTNTGSLGLNGDYSGEPQRYGQYSFHFIDYNSNFDADLGDENLDGDFIGDDDDEYLGEGPDVFNPGISMKDLYLINGAKDKRTMLRWHVINEPSYIPCDFLTDPSNPTGTGCLGTIQFLKLDGKDWGTNHDILTIDTDNTQYDGVIDTWIIDPDFTDGLIVVAGSNADTYWQNLFPSSIDVDKVNFELYPNKNLDYAWRNFSPEINISPYTRMQLTLSPSWKVKSRLKGKVPKIEINTTINLTDIFSN